MELAIKQLNVRKSNKNILCIPKLELRQAPITAIWGPNGAGKTTLLRCLVNLEKYEGRITWNGLHKDRSLMKLFAWVPSQCQLAFDTSAKDFLLYSRYMHHKGFISNKDRRIVDETLALLNLKELGDQPISSLSSGEWQKIQVARGISGQAKMIILDEPCAHLDIGARHELMNILKTVTCETGCRIIMTSHDLYTIPKFVDYSIAIKKGRVHVDHDGPLEENEIADLFNLR